MKIKVFLSVIIFSLAVFSACLAEVSIRAEADKMSLSTDGILTYKLTLVSDENNLSTPQFPQFEDFNVVSSAQSSTVSFAKTGAKSQVQYSLLLVPKKTGKFKIGPAILKTKKGTYSSEAFEIEVTQGRPRSKEPPEETPSMPRQFEPDSGQPQITL